jgi:hypothetical protein
MLAERQRAEQQLAQMREQRQGFFRQMLGGALRTGGALGQTLGIGAPRATGTGLPATSGQGGTGLATVGGVAGAAVGGPLGGMVGRQLGGGVQPTAAAPAGASTTQLVDRVTGGMSGWVGAPAPAMTDTSGLTDEEYIQWLMSQRGGA